MSNINSNGINPSYPTPGINNTTQGFRDNFAAIKNNIDAAATEITDLQNKVILKQALTGATINNDMANTLISNALVKSFRATTYNLGNDLSGIVKINAQLGDVQYGNITANTVLQLGGWAPTGVQSNLQLQLTFSNANAYVTFPNTVAYSQDSGSTTLENVQNVAGNVTISIPNGVKLAEYRLSTMDCGDTIVIEPYNRPRISTQAQQRTPGPTGFPGDVAGTIAVDQNYFYVCTGSFDSSNVPVTTATATFASGNLITLGSIANLAINNPIVFDGTVFGNITANTVYYIKTISGSNITISNTRVTGTAGPTYGPLTNGSGTMTVTSFNGANIWQKVELGGW